MEFGPAGEKLITPMPEDEQTLDGEVARIIALPGPDQRRPPRPVELVPRDYSREACQHLLVRVDPEKRTLHCRNPNCRALLDPVTWLIDWAKRSHAREQQTDHSLQELQRLRAELTVHAPGRDGALTLCPAGSGRRAWTVCVSNIRRRITCKDCRRRLGDLPPRRPEPVPEPAPAHSWTRLDQRLLELQTEDDDGDHA